MRVIQAMRHTGDRMLAALVPHTTAKADPGTCYTVRCWCSCTGRWTCEIRCPHGTEFPEYGYC